MSQVSIVSCLGTLLTSIQGWVFLKIPTTGTMTTQNIKDTCETLGYSATCFCSHGCSTSDDGNNCVKTFKNLPSHYTLHGVSSQICSENTNPTHWWKCEPMYGICVYGSNYYGISYADCSDEAGGHSHNDANVGSTKLIKAHLHICIYARYIISIYTH